MPRQTVRGPSATSSKPWEDLSVKTSPMTQAQWQQAEILVSVGQQLGVHSTLMVACVYAGIWESGLSDNTPGEGGGTWGCLSGQQQYFQMSDTAGMAKAFYWGGNGFQPPPGGGQHGGAWYEYQIQGVRNPVSIALEVEAPYKPYSESADGYPGDSQATAQAAQIVAAAVGTSVPGETGGVYSVSGNGKPGNSTQVSPWIVGDSQNPDQDYWTTINQYGQQSQWYVFADAESLYVADGDMLTAQTPAIVISPYDARVIQMELVYDNTSYSSVVTHVKRGKVMRRSTLARAQTPTQITMNLICDIDDIRGGDVVYLTQAGPARGPWLVAECRRSAFQAYSELTLTAAAMPLNAITGLPVNVGVAEPTREATKPSSGTVISVMISYAQSLNNADYPYVWGGGHAHAGTASIGEPGGPGYNGHTVGFDCSGTVGAVMASAGLGLNIGDPVQGDAGLVQQLLSEQVIRPGIGAGSIECSIFDNPGHHIFMRLDGRFFGTEDGSGHLPHTQNQGAGWIPDGQVPSAPFVAYHVPQQALLGYISGSNATSAQSGGVG